MGLSDLGDALQGWDRQREQVGLIHQAFLLTLPRHSSLVHSLQAHRHDYPVADTKFDELRLDAADRLAAELQELARRARHYQSLKAAYESQETADSVVGRASPSPKGRG